ncbi:hypothetical protein GBF38_006305, partial [Nibea albiflora]
ENNVDLFPIVITPIPQRSGWWRFIIVSLGLAALIVIVVAVNMWARTKGENFEWMMMKMTVQRTMRTSHLLFELDQHSCLHQTPPINSFYISSACFT